MIFKQIRRIVPLPDNSSKSLECTWNITILFHVPNVQRLFEATWDVSPHWHSIVSFSGDFSGRLKIVFFSSPSLSLSLLFEWRDLRAGELYRPMKSLNEKDLDFTYLLICIYGQRPRQDLPYIFVHCNPWHRLRIWLFTPSPHCTKMGPGHVDPETRRRRRRSVILWTEVNIRWTPGKQNVKMMRSLASPWSLMISWICTLWSNMGYHDLSGFVFGKSSNKLCVEVIFTHSLRRHQLPNGLQWPEEIKMGGMCETTFSVARTNAFFLYFCGQEVLRCWTLLCGAKIQYKIVIP